MADVDRKIRGIRMSRINVALICVAFILCAMLVFSTYQTTNQVNGIVRVTDSYLDSQQAGGMMRDFAAELSGQAMAFVQSGEPGAAKGYESRMNILEAQLALYVPDPDGTDKSDDAYEQALEAYRAQQADDIRAMRLAADALPEDAFGRLPAFLREAKPDPADEKLTPEQKKAAATALLTGEEYAGYAETIRAAVDLNHRLSSEEAKKQAAETSRQVQRIALRQKLLVYGCVLLAVLALLVNWRLIISPIRKSIGNLDRREPIPERGSYEMRHLAYVYNEVLRDNQEKAEALSYAATHDALTGLLNRAVFDRTYWAARNDAIGLIVVDVDHFKQYNDEFGHDIGDRVLITAADALTRNFREEDMICRAGGDEFYIIMPGLGQAHAGEIRERIENINRELAQKNDDLPPVTLSAGVAFHDRPNPNGSLFKDADSTLLEHKKTRDTCCAVYGE